MSHSDSSESQQRVWGSSQTCLDLWINTGGFISGVCHPRRYLTWCFSVREGALTFFFWFTLQIPESQQKEMTAERVNAVLHQELTTSFNSSGSLSYQAEYRVNPDSLILLGKYQLLKCGLSSQKWPKVGQRCWREVIRSGQKSLLKEIGQI